MKQTELPTLYLRLLLFAALFLNANVLLSQSTLAGSFPPEDCFNGLDDDADGYIDCYDVDCHCFDPPDCATTIPPNTDISIQPAWKSEPFYGNGTLSGIGILGNLNPQTDDIPEILVLEPGASNHNWDIRFYRGDGSNAFASDSLKLVKEISEFNEPLIGDVDGDKIPELITSEGDMYLRVYRNYTPGANPVMSHWITASNKMQNAESRPMLADLDGEGTPEIVMDNEVFIFDLSDPASPKLRKVLDAGNNNPSGKQYYSLGFVPSSVYASPAVADLLSTVECNGDPDCEGLEIAAGPAIYSVDLDTMDGDGFQIKMQRDLNLMESPDVFGDGYTAVADMDIDGIPDIVVLGRGKVALDPAQLGVYVWNKNGLLRHMNIPIVDSIWGRFYSMPMIANVFDDTKRGLVKDFPEVVFSTSANMYCFNLHATNFPNLAAWWTLPMANQLFGSDASSTAFDFNGDGLSEIVFCDNFNLRIIYGGHLPFPPGVDANRNWASTPFLQGATGFTRYPVVADVDNDGQAEIVQLGKTNFNSSSDYLPILHVFESAGLPWPPCRNVWNQYNYNIVNVNDDLGIPIQPQQHWKEFPAPGSGKRPLNMALGQRGPLNGAVLLPLADLESQGDTVYCDKDSLRLRLRVCNSGSVASPAGLSLQWYQGNPTTVSAPPMGAPFLFPSIISKDSCTFWELAIPLPPNGALYGIINDNGSLPGPIDLANDFPSTNLKECDYANNLFSILVSYTTPALDLGPDQMVCKDALTTLSASPGFSRYRWQDGSMDASFLASGIGTYWVDAWDICGNLFSDTLRLSAIPTPALALGPDRLLCQGDTLTLATAGFDQVNWNSAGTTICTACPTLAISPAADMTLVASGQSGACVERDTISIAISALPQISAQVIETHCGNSDGSIDLQVSSPLPYQIQWASGQTQAAISGLAAGTYSVTVTSDAACSQSASYSINNSIAVALDAAVLTQVPCFGGQTGAISVSVASGISPYLYDWSTGPGGAVLAGLSAGNYALTVTDQLGCTATATYQLSEPPQLSVLSTVTGTSCSSTTGDITLSPQGGTSPYFFVWGGGQNTPDLNDLPPGNYAVTITDANGCQIAQSFDIQAGGSPVISDSMVIPLRCHGESTGAISLNASLGMPPYQFLWSNGANTASLTGLAAGTYSVTTTDANGCSATAQFSLGQPEAISLWADIDSTSCTSSVGNISVMGQGGTAPFAYIWSNGSNTPVVNNLGPGTYTVTVSDEYGCSLEQAFTLAPGGAPVIAGSEVLPVACSGGSNGQITVEVNGGVPPYQFQWSTGAIASILGNLPAGDYAFTATGANGCVATVQFTVTEPPLLALTGTVDSSSCFSETGNISVAPQGGTAPYTYLWDNGQSTAALNGVPAGNYVVTTTDSEGCTASDTYSILPGGSPELADSVVTAVGCFGESNGAISVQITGGVMPYQFEWPSGPGSNVLNNLPAGAYQLTISDQNNCSMVATFAVSTPAAIGSALTSAPDTCGQSNGAIEVSTSGGTAPFAYQWSDGQTTEDRAGIPAGTYPLTVTDANGCTFTVETEVLTLDILPLFTLSGDTITCAQASVSVTPNPAPANWDFEWQTPGGALLAGAQQVIVEPGQYQLTAVNELGCASVQMMEIPIDTLRPQAQVAATELKVPCDQSPVLLDGTGSSMGALFAASWHRELNGQVLWDTAALVAQTSSAGTFILQITNLQNGCTDQGSVQVSAAQPISGAVLALDSISCFGLEDGAIQVESVTGGLAPYLYAIDNQSFGTTAAFTGLAEGSYILTIQDANGCEWHSGPLTIETPLPLSLSLLASDTRIDQGEAVTLQAQVQPPGAVPSQIQWSPPAYFDLPASLTETVRPAETTLFQVAVQDENGCTASDTLRVWVRREAIYVPNVFQPGSSDNDQFTVFAGADILEVTLLQVYDRWGELLFEKRHFPPNAPDQGWDGNYRGKALGPGVYVYYLEVALTGGRTTKLKGSVTIVR